MTSLRAARCNICIYTGLCRDRALLLLDQLLILCFFPLNTIVLWKRSMGVQIEIENFPRVGGFVNIDLKKDKKLMFWIFLGWADL